MMEKAKTILLALLPAVLALAAWEYATAGSERLQFLYASPSMVAKLGWQELANSAFYADIGTTFAEAILGLLLGVTLGSLGGLLLWGNGRAHAIIRPYLVFIGAIPVFALAPVFILWFGIGLPSKAIMSAFAVFFVCLLQAYDGAQFAASHYTDFARSIRASHRKVICKIIVPGALAFVFTGIRISVGLALTGAFIAEFVSSERGLGHYILSASSLYDMPRVFWGLFVMAILALIMTFTADFLQKKLAH